MYKDPEIPISDALALVNGNQSELARKLNVTRATISQWKVEKRVFLPPLQAYRMLQMYPGKFGDAA